MRIFYDAVTPANIPADAQGVFAYIDGDYRNVDEMRQRFPHLPLATIAVDPAHDANVLDCEKGDATPAQCPPWAVRQRARGGVPVIYMNGSTWPAVIAAFNAAGVAQPLYGVAVGDGVAAIPPGALYKQFTLDFHGYDIDAVADFFPGVDASNETPLSGGETPLNPTTSKDDEDLMTDISQKSADMIGASVAQHLLAGLVPVPGGGQISVAAAIGAEEAYTQADDQANQNEVSLLSQLIQAQHPASAPAVAAHAQLPAQVMEAQGATIDFLAKVLAPETAPPADASPDAPVVGAETTTEPAPEGTAAPAVVVAPETAEAEHENVAQVVIDDAEEFAKRVAAHLAQNNQA